MNKSTSNVRKTCQIHFAMETVHQGNCRALRESSDRTRTLLSCRATIASIRRLDHCLRSFCLVEDASTSSLLAKEGSAAAGGASALALFLRLGTNGTSSTASTLASGIAGAWARIGTASIMSWGT